MITTSLDRDSLLGLLALQLGFVSRDSLLEAIRIWRADPAASLEELLLARGGLRRDHHAILKGLAERMPVPSGTNGAAALPARGPAEVPSDGSAAPIKAETLATRGENLDLSPFTGLRYGILRPLGRGGLGEVYVAEDREVHREVALKQLQDRHADDPPSRERFLLEAEITGGLEHPGVVPVYGLGTYPDGRPFYAMRLIRGETLQKFIDRFHAQQGDRPESLHGRALHQLLTRFVAVCQVIAYAHSRGVIHRDIKPSNVMLGQYGETLVVDWGLAKLLGESAAREDSEERPLGSSRSDSSGSGHTVPGSAMGTPQYMSPEQAAGRIDKLGPATDVYSLGATLYCVLTGRPPFESGADVSLGELLQDVEKGRFRPPREVNSAVPAALEAVCLKAMARKIGDRYSSVQALTADVENWMADEPVGVYEEPFTQRAIRWMRRHRTGSLTAVGMLVAVLVTALLASFELARWADRERAARLEADQARVSAERMRRQNLAVAAHFATRTVANEIDLRFRILESSAADARLQRLLIALRDVDDPVARSELQDLQTWLVARHAETADTSKALSWLILDHRGLMFGRSPPEPRIIGKSYAYRDYFHGLGHDLPAEDVPERMINNVHLSNVFESTVTRRLNVAFSVPVRETTAEGAIGRDLGVLVMVVELGRFAELRLGLGQDKLAVLLDTRTDHLSGESRRGLVLHHPLLRQSEADESPLPRLSPAQVDFLVRLREGRTRADPNFPDHTASRDSSTGQEDNIDLHYDDPVTRGQGAPWVAAFEPVLVKGRPDPIRDTGWVVGVQERPETGTPNR